MASSPPFQSESCSDESPSGGVSLPVVDSRRIRKSGAGKWRAAVLIAVNVLMILHVLQWLWTGTTVAPFEPSEAMEFSKHGVINVGLIFFALTILSTLILGRWFCGWGCHLVGLQDLSRWVLGKMRIKPKPARMGLLALVPLIAFVYMFVGPVVWRMVHSIPLGERETHLMTTEFWATFPNEWLPIALTLLVCGFVIIYLLGSKGFCTFGCPYGAIFGVADQLAPWRIRVTDACRGCGHCTAVCTSNVRVHQEVRDFGMVVDPGCMKCRDCVSVCPNDALYFGPGIPALLAVPRTERPPASQAGAARALPRWILTAAYLFASFGLLMWFDGQFNWLVITILAAGSLVIATAFKGKSDRLQGYSLPEEALACALFLAAVYALRGLYGQVPFLFCLGLAAIASYLGVEFARLAYKSNLSIHQWRLKRGGRLAGAGYAFVAIMLGVFGFGAYAAAGHKPVLAQKYFAQGVVLASQDRVPQAIEMFKRALAWQRDYRPAQTKLAGLYCADRRYEEGIELCQRSLEQEADDAEAHFFLGWAYAETKKFDLAEQHLRRAAELAPQWPAPRDMLSRLRPRRDAGQAESVEAEVLAQMRNQPIGRQTLAALNLPEELLRRAVDRVIRSSYREQFHVVVQDDPATALPGEGLPETENAPTPTESIGEQAIRVLQSQPAEAVLAYRRSLPEFRPSLRGFRAPILEHARVALPIHEPPVTAPAAIREAADMVAANLAREGLLPTLAEVIRVLGPAGFADPPRRALSDHLALLRDVGLPIDFLAYFPPPNAPARAPHASVSFVAKRLLEGVSDVALRDELREIPFRFIKSRPDYRVATESGEDDIGLIRLQMTRGSYWRGIGSGDGVDIARQLVARLPDASFLLSIETKHLDEFVELAKGWPWNRPEQLTICVEPLIVAQWAQDNGKAGTVGAEESGARQPATLVPRYASRREDGTVFVPGETFLADGLAAAGHVVIQSPLLFQGGNLLAVRDPKTGERILLVGEAEIYRNTALGLTREQVLQAFATEFDVDRCVVLPAVSFHIDFDLTARAHNGKLIAFVNDDDRAVRLILELGTEALVTHGVLDAAAAQNAKAHLRAGRSRDFLTSILDPVFGQANAGGQFPLSLANRFSAGPADSPVGNFQRFLVALDILAAQTLAPAEWPGNRHAQAYMRSIRRRSADRRALHEQLRRLGWKVVLVPSLADADRGINYLNGLHERKRYIMPAYGGFYAPLDQAAAGVFAAELGGVEVVPILCGESQRRVGAVHCSVSAYPKPK